MSDADAIAALNREWEARFTNRDLAGLVDLFTDDCVRLPEGGPASAGKEALADAYRHEFGPLWEGTFEVAIRTDEVVGGGEYAFARGTDTLVPAGGETYKGTWLAIYRREPDGAWKYFWSTSNTGA